MIEVVAALFPQVPVEIEANVCASWGKVMREDDEMSEPTHDYRARQAVRDAEYREAYTAWVQAVSPKQRATLKASGFGHCVKEEEQHLHGSDRRDERRSSSNKLRPL